MFNKHDIENLYGRLGLINDKVHKLNESNQEMASRISCLEFDLRNPSQYKVGEKLASGIILSMEVKGVYVNYEDNISHFRYITLFTPENKQVIIKESELIKIEKELAKK